MLYENQKLSRYVHGQLSRIYGGADKSRKRTLTWGTIATLGWIAVVVNMPSVQKCRHVYAHLGMMALGSCIALTMRENYGNAVKAQKESLDLIKKLRLSKTHENIEKIRIETQKLSRKYEYYLLNCSQRSRF